MGEIQYKLSWNDYGQIVEDLWKDLQAKLTQNNVKIDAIVIILREGGFTGLPLAYKLNTYKVMTLQFKYMLYNGSNELKYIAGMPEVTYELPKNPVFLLCDSFPAGGETKKLAVAKIKEKYPTAKFVFASLVEDKTSNQVSEIIFSAFGVDADEEAKTNYPLLKNAGVTNIYYILLPWENEKEELAGPDHKEWKYN